MKNVEGITLAESAEDQKTESPPVPAGRVALLAAFGRTAIRSVGTLLPKLFLFLFMLVLPFALIAYPAYRISGRLLDYSVSSTVEAKLMHIDIRAVELGQDQTSLFEARKHFDVVFYLEGPKATKYASAVEMSWPAPGLKRRLENQYPIGDTFTLYRLPDKTIELDDIVAKDSIYRLTGLMGLIFVATAIFFMLWKRLAGRMSAIVPRFPVATEKSILLGQFVTLSIAGLLAVLMTFSPLAIPSLFYVGAYWGLAAFISLTLRLLVFENPPEPVPEPPEDVRRSRSSETPRK